MAITSTLADQGGKQPSSPVITLALNLALDNAYPLGGYAFNPQTELRSKGGFDKLPSVLAVLVEPKAGLTFQWDRDANKLKAYRADGAFRNMTLSNPGLAIGSGSKAKVLIANTVVFLIAGVFKSKTTAEIAFTATTHDIAPNASSIQEAVYLLTLNAAGTATITKGTTATGAGNAAVPAAPAGQAVIGHVRVAVAAGATLFDASSDNLDAAHLTATYTSLAFHQTVGQNQEVEEAVDLSGVTGVRALILAK